MGSGKKVTVGYRYYLGLHFGICHGPVDAVQKVVIGEREAWVGFHTTTGTISIDNPQLFGGDKREGGVVGDLNILMGTSGQSVNSYLQAKIGGTIPAFRGILSAVWNGGQVTSNNPYLKPWAFRVKRILQGWSGGSAWYPEKAEIFRNANPDIIGSGYWFVPAGTEYRSPAGLYGTAPADYIGTADQIAQNALDARNAYESTSYTLGGSYSYDWAGGVDIGAWAVESGPSIGRVAAKGVLPVCPNGGVYSLVQQGVDLTSLGMDNPAVVCTLSTTTGDMNPAHIVYQCLTDTQWGMGYPTTAIDNTSFTAAADALYSEEFGLSLLWNQQQTIEQFISVILDHIGGILYVDPASGKFALRLIRADYNRGTLPLYGPTTLIAVENYQRQAWGETVNEITVVYTDASTEKDASITVQDIANIAVQGGVVALTRNYPGIRTGSLAQRVAMRDLQAGSTPLASVKLTATRAAWQVFPGDVFRLTWPEYGIDDVVYRALDVNRGTLTDGQIIIDAVEDVFGLPDNTYLVEQPGGWVDPSQPPAAAPYRKLLEAPYWDLARNLSAADLDYVDALSGYLETLAVRPSGDAINYEIQAKVGAAAYEAAGNGDFCPSATVVGALTKTTTAITLASGVDLDLVEVGGYAIIDDEYVLVSAIDAVTGTATISRGLLDTVPAEHSAGARIWFADGDHGFSTNEYADGEIVDVKLLPATGQGTLDISLAPADSLTMDQRQYRPYAPGKLLVNTAAYPEWIDGLAALALTWAHRDRLSQTAYLVEQSEASIGPEVGVTYTLRLYGEDDSLLRTESALSGTSYNYTTSNELTDVGGVGDSFWSNVRCLLHLNGSNNSTVMTDETGRTWTASGNAKITTSDSVFGGACLSLDGTGDYISTVHDTALTDSNYFKVEGRFKTNAASSTKLIVTKRYNSTLEGFQLLTLGSKLYCDIFCSGSTTLSLTGTTTIVNGTWYYFELRKSGSTWYLRLNASTEASGTEPAAWVQGTSPLVIGMNNFQPGWAWNGLIDEFRITAGADRGNELSVPGAEFGTGTGRMNGRLRFELESVRGGLVSYQKHNHTVLREGYGFNYGYYYGGQ